MRPQTWPVSYLDVSGTSGDAPRAARHAPPQRHVGRGRAQRVAVALRRHLTADRE